jgi:periplasmic mercuric ion binding protein
MKKNLLLSGLLICFLISNAVAQDTTVVIKSTAQCGECKEKIETALNFEKGVKSSNVDVETKEVTVVYNASKTSPENIRIAISKAGYDADSVPADEKAYKRLKPCCTKDGHKHD